MNKRIIVTEKQLREYIERKKAEKVFSSILNEMHKNSKFLNDSIPLNEANQTIIERYNKNKKINSRVKKLLEDYKIIDGKGRII